MFNFCMRKFCNKLNKAFTHSALPSLTKIPKSFSRNKTFATNCLSETEALNIKKKFRMFCKKIIFEGSGTMQHNEL